MIKKKLAEWLCMLNIWQWPDDFPFKKPDGFDDMTYYRIRQLFIFKISWKILWFLVPKKDFLREWHTNPKFTIRETEEEFNVWWKNRSICK